MQDRFKFRVWNFDNKKYFQQNKKGMFILDGELPNGTSVGVSCSLEDLANSNNYGKKFIIEQCTGLKDKNGKLIYEGDILKITSEKYHTYEIQCVEFCQSVAAYWFHRAGYMGVLAEDSEFEIIGNINENPEKLKIEEKDLWI